MQKRLDNELTDTLAAVIAKKITAERRKSENYGLTSQTVKVNCKNGNADMYPWQGMTVPVLIIAEYPAFLVGTVLPHMVIRGYRESLPYNITIDKHDIAIGVIVLNGGSIL